jgi:hypothetical protein
LFELADYNKLELTKCRRAAARADDALYNLIKFDNIPNVKSSNFTETNAHRQSSACQCPLTQALHTSLDAFYSSRMLQLEK